LREKKWKEKADQKRQEELDREKWEEGVWKEVDQKKWEGLKFLKKTVNSWKENKQAHWVDIDRVSCAFLFHDPGLTCLFSPPKLLPMQRQGHPRGR